DSGGQIWAYVSGLAKSARGVLPPGPTGRLPGYITLHFASVKLDGAEPDFPAPAEGTPANSCLEVEKRSQSITGSAAAAAANRKDYPVTASGSSSRLRVEDAPNPTELDDDENREARQLIAGMLLNRLNRPAGANAQEYLE